MDPPARPHDSPPPVLRWPPATPVLMLAGAAFSLTLFFNFGYQSGGSFAFTALGVLALVAGMLLLQRRPHAPRGPLAGALVAWLAVATALAASDEPWSIFAWSTAHDAPAATARALFVAAFLLVCAGAVRDARWLSFARLGVLGVAFLVAADWTLAQSPVPAIDVWHFHQHAAQRLEALRSPYELSFDNPYGAGTLDFYAYPPVTLLLQVPFHLATGDVRWASVLGIAVTAACARGLAAKAGLPSFAADAAAGVALLQGRPFYIIEQGWTEPVVAGLAGIAGVAWARRSAWAAAALALALSAKQFLWLFVPAVAFLPVARRDLVRAACVVGAAFLPFLLWSPVDFWQGVVVNHFDGTAMRAMFPDLGPGDPWPRSDTVAVHLQQYELGWTWPLWVGAVAWVGTGVAFVAARQREAGTLLVTAAAGLACLGFLGTAFHPNYIWFVAVLVLLGVLVDGATARTAPHAAA